MKTIRFILLGIVAAVTLPGCVSVEREDHAASTTTTRSVSTPAASTTVTTSH